MKPGTTTRSYINSKRDILSWWALPLARRLADRHEFRTYAAWETVQLGLVADVDYVVRVSTKWSNLARDRYPSTHDEFVAMAADLG